MVLPEDDAAAPSMGFDDGALVSLTGLTQHEYNNHVGKVVAAQCRGGRVAVALHGAIWSEVHGKKDAPKMFKPENLRCLMTPVAGARVSSWGCISADGIIHLMSRSGLPDTAAKLIAAHLQVRRVSPEDVAVTSWSSKVGNQPILVALDASEQDGTRRGSEYRFGAFPTGCGSETWNFLSTHSEQGWTSSFGSMPTGCGSEYLEFSFAQLRRVAHVAIRIQPNAPFSVRDFQISVKGRADGDWSVASSRLHTLDRDDLQEFALQPPCDVWALRLICTRNITAANMAASMGSDSCEGVTLCRGYNCIGLDRVAFA